MKVSKELLSNVLDRRKTIIKYELVGSTLRWWEDLEGECSDYMEINVYELAHKCKLKALNRYPSLMLESSVTHNKTGNCSVSSYGIPLGYFEADSEVDSVFIAYEYFCLKAQQ